MSGFLTDLGFAGQRATTSIINAHSSGGSQSSSVGAGNTPGARQLLSGALTAGTLAVLLNVTGSGAVPLLSLYAKDTTSRTLHLKVTVDGVVVFDSTSSAINGVDTGIFAAGAQSAPSVFAPSKSIDFNRSLKVEIASSLTENNLIALAYMMNRT